MRNRTKYDAVVVGAGPNGLTAGAILAGRGLKVLLIEARDEIGGGCRTAELTLPGFKHDVCSAIHPMAVISPAFQELNLAAHGVEWVHSQAPLAHPLPGGGAAVLHRSIETMSAALGADAAAWEKMFAGLVENSSEFFDSILRPIRLPSHPWLMARFARVGLRSCESVLHRFATEEARALFTGSAAHSILPLDRAGTASFGLILTLCAHAVGWPFPRGGSSRIVRALEACFRERGGEIATGQMVRALSDIPESRVVLFDLSPRQVARIARDALPSAYLRQLEDYVHGPGAFKADWALAGPIPWENPECGTAATVHVGGTAAEIIASEREIENGRAPERPFVLLAQPSLFDRSRAPEGKQTAWAYCHVPNGCAVDMTERLERQVERFAPGFRDLILARHVIFPAGFELYNPNCAGGDIVGGANTLLQTVFRPVPRWNPYRTPNERLFLCSSSTPPGGGVHGMCGYWAAQAALRCFGKQDRSPGER